MTTATERALSRRQASESAAPADVFVVFGITGDLARVMTFRSLYRLDAGGLLDSPIVGVAAQDWTVQELREHARECIAATGEQIDASPATSPTLPRPTPYEVLLSAAMRGDSTRFTRQDAVEETWRVMQPLHDSPPAIHGYAPGTWGPEAADHLIAGHGRWHEPWTEAS